MAGMLELTDWFKTTMTGVLRVPVDKVDRMQEQTTKRQAENYPRKN